jgi:hypothetical protein
VGAAEVGVDIGVGSEVRGLVYYEISGLGITFFVCRRGVFLFTVFGFSKFILIFWIVWQYALAAFAICSTKQPKSMPTPND